MIGSYKTPTNHPVAARGGGFSLMELLVVIVVIGVLSAVIAPPFSSLAGLKNKDYRSEQRLINQEIGMSLLGFARYHTDHGTLPAPYMGGEGGLVSTVCGPGCGGVFDVDGNGDVDEKDAGRLPGLREELRRSGIDQRAINHDARALPRIRVYQKARLPGTATGPPDTGTIAMEAPLFGRHGPSVILRYDFGVIYTTDCPVTDDSCFRKIGGTGLPGDSDLMTAFIGDEKANVSSFTGWQAEGRDMGAFFISTLPLQKQMLRITAERIDRIRDQLTEYHLAAQLAAEVGAKDLYPAPSTPRNPTAPDPGGYRSVAGGDCKAPWYNLASARLDILFRIGLSTNPESAQKEYGRTPWGGTIEYCRDYYPPALGNLCARNPRGPACRIDHAAIRIHRSVSEGLAPDPVDAGRNLVLVI